MGIGTPDDLDGEVVDMRDSGGQFLPGIAAIGEETAQGRIGVATAFDEVRCAVAVLDVSGEHQSVEEVAGRVGRDMALAALDLLAGIIAARPTRFGGPRGPPASVVLTDWLSMMPAVGSASRPSAIRTPATSTALIASSRPLSRIR